MTAPLVVAETATAVPQDCKQSEAWTHRHYSGFEETRKAYDSEPWKF
jgi:hypothetical protein